MNDKGRDRPKATDDLVAQAVHYQMSGKRRGTAATKKRNEVRGGGSKPWRQKGTGRARHGSIRAPQWAGGGRAFGSSRRNYSVKMNRKARRKALAAVLRDIKEEGRIVIEALEFDAPSTRRFVEFLEEKSLDGKVLLLCGEGYGRNVVLSARNVPRVKCMNASCINFHDLLDADWLLVSPGDAEVVESRIAGIGE